MKNTNNTLQLELHVPDFEIVKEFYGFIGFKVLWERKPEGHKGYIVIQNDAGCILNFWGGNQEIFNQSYFMSFDPTTKRGYGVEVVIPTNIDLNVLEERIKQSKGKIVDDIKQQPWGLADFRCEDPFGYYLRITTPHDITDPSNAVA